MDVITHPDVMRSWSHGRRGNGAVVGVVPTMGALHRGHLALITEAKRLADAVVVTIFVNPKQFNQSGDFDTYPRPIDDDLVACRRAGVDAVYAPTATTVYPPGFETHVDPGPLADHLEGAMRPGHFRGVTTVVTKLFGATSPDLAVFGQKDYQQLAIIRRMSADLDLGVEIVAVPTVREPDGLALSSRNTRLGVDERRAAIVIPSALDRAVDAFDRGERDPEIIGDLVRSQIGAEPLAQLEYVAVVDAGALSKIERLDSDAVVLTAAWFGDVRLIDNRLLDRHD